MILGLLQATSAASALQEGLIEDPDAVVRSQAAISLGEIGLGLSILTERSESDTSRDVRHQCEMAAYRIQHGIAPSPDRVTSYASLDESMFEKVKVGKPALDFVLQDTNGTGWRLSDFRGKKKVALIWVFADWCPVCHNEFHELIELKQEFGENDLQVFTLECHDLYRCRVMVGAEFQPKYWFTKESLQKLYSEKIWWPHLVDLAGAVGAAYGVQPMEYVVHSEWINRPSTIIIDEGGIVRLAYYGTYWGDRPTIKQTLDMMQSGKYQFEPPKRKS
jgi:peroxiredoxin